MANEQHEWRVHAKVSRLHFLARQWKHWDAIRNGPANWEGLRFCPKSGLIASSWSWHHGMIEVMLRCDAFRVRVGSKKEKKINHSKKKKVLQKKISRNPKRHARNQYPSKMFTGFPWPENACKKKSFTIFMEKNTCNPCCWNVPWKMYSKKKTGKAVPVMLEIFGKRFTSTTFMWKFPARNVLFKEWNYGRYIQKFGMASPAMKNLIITSLKLPCTNQNENIDGTSPHKISIKSRSVVAENNVKDIESKFVSR